MCCVQRSNITLRVPVGRLNQHCEEFFLARYSPTRNDEFALVSPKKRKMGTIEYALRQTTKCPSYIAPHRMLPSKYDEGTTSTRATQLARESWHTRWGGAHIWYIALKSLKRKRSVLWPTNHYKNLGVVLPTTWRSVRQLFIANDLVSFEISANTCMPSHDLKNYTRCLLI
jgi:hypothetical protein